jgi:hypothetical protein
MNIFIEKSNDELHKVKYLDSYMSNHKGFIAGGVFKNIFDGKAFKDIDIFFENKKDFNQGLDHFTKSTEFVKIYENKNAVCFSKKDSGVKVDLVHGSYGSPEETINKFDFTVAKFAYFKKETEGGVSYTCTFHKDFFEHLMTRKLVIDNNIPFPVGTFERAFRYKRYGFGMCRESKAKLIESLQGQSTDNLSRDLYFGFD